MKLPKLPKPKMPNFLKRKERKRLEKLLADYEKGIFLQVDNNVDNKEFFKNNGKC